MNLITLYVCQKCGSTYLPSLASNPMRAWDEQSEEEKIAGYGIHWRYLCAIPGCFGQLSPAADRMRALGLWAPPEKKKWWEFGSGRI